MVDWPKEQRQQRRNDIAKGVETLAAEWIADRQPVPLHVRLLKAAGFDPERTVTDYEGEDWGLEAHGDLWEASIARHVPLKYLTDADVDRLLYWGACAEPLVMLALHYLEQDPFHATGAGMRKPLLTNVATTLYPGGYDYDLSTYRVRFAAVRASARALAMEGNAVNGAGDAEFDPGTVVRDADAATRRFFGSDIEAPRW